MGAPFTVTINSINSGQQSTQDFPGEGQFLFSRAIDPDVAANIDETQPYSGKLVTPVASQNEITAPSSFDAPTIAMVPGIGESVPRLYCINNDANMFNFTILDSSLTQAGSFVNFNGTNCDGGFYYNNYIYATGTASTGGGVDNNDISRYGPLDGTPAAENAVWSGSTLGSQKPLNGDIDFPSINSIKYPTHWGHVHTDNKAYICDFQGRRGVIHAISTAASLNYDAQAGDFTVGLTVTGGTSGATGVIAADNDSGATGTLTLENVTGTFENNENITDTSTGDATVNGTLTEGALDNGSAFNVLDLPLDYRPITIESYGTDLVIAAIKFPIGTQNPTSDSGSPALFFWDTVSDSFYRQVDLPEVQFVTALKNNSGTLVVFGGSADSVGQAAVGGHYVGIYDGADNVTWSTQISNGHPPFQGGVDTYGGRISWGTQVTQPEKRAVAMSTGSKYLDISSNAVFTPLMTTLTTEAQNDAISTALIYPFAGTGSFPKICLASHSNDESDNAIDIPDSGGTQDSIIEFGSYNIGQSFRIDKIRIPLAEAVGSGVTITPSLLIDDRQDTYTMQVINNTNYSNSERNIVYKKPELTQLSTGEKAGGEHDFIFKLAFSGTTPTSVKFPIIIEGTTLDD